MSLNFKLSLAIITMMVVFSSIGAVIVLRFQRETTTDQFHQSSAALSAAIRVSLEQDMLLADREYIQTGVSRVAMGDMVNGVTVYSANKAIYASAGGLVSHRTDISSTLAEVLSEVEGMTVIVGVGNEKEMHTIAPILNSSECWGCHDSSIEVLGAIDIALDMSAMNDDLRSQNTLIAIFAVVSFALSALALSILMRKMVLNRLSNLSASAVDISEGQYSVRVDANVGDEIGILGRAFNKMAEGIQQRTTQLEESERRLSQWNVELNERVQQMTSDIAAFNEVTRTVSQSRDLDTILNDVIGKIIVIMQAEGGAVYLFDEAEEQMILAVKQGFMGEEDVEDLQVLDSNTEILAPVLIFDEAVVVDTLVASAPEQEQPDKPQSGNSYIVVALRSKGKVLGVIALFGAKLIDAAPEAKQLLVAMSDEIGMGVDNAITAEKLREVSVEIHLLLSGVLEEGFETGLEDHEFVKQGKLDTCHKTDCPAYESENLKCWKMIGVFPENELPEIFDYRDCPQFRKSHAHDDITAIGENFNSMMGILSDWEDQLRRSNIELATLVRCGQILLGSVASLHVKLQQVMDTVSTAVRGTAGILFLYSPEAGCFLVEASGGCDPEPLDEMRLQAEEWVLGVAFKSGDAVILVSPQDIEKLAGTLSESNRNCLERAREGLSRSRNLLCAPILLGGDVPGLLCLFNFPDLQALDVPSAQTLADQIAITIENDRLYQEVRQREQNRGELLKKLISAQEEERKRVARELHDEAGQAITALMMSTSMAASMLPEDMKDEQAAFLETYKLAQAALSQIRKVILELRPAVLDDLGLAPAIRWYAKRNLESAGIEVQLELHLPKKRLPAEIEITVFRVAQESFTNIVRHSGASRVEVKLMVEDGSLRLEIRDDGKGFAPEAIMGRPGLDRGWGLKGMEERINLLSGLLDIKSALGEGTVVQVEIPLREEIDECDPGNDS